MSIFPDWLTPKYSATQLDINEKQLSVNQHLTNTAKSLLITIAAQQDMLDIQRKSLLEITAVIKEFGDTIRLVTGRLDDHIKRSIHDAHDSFER